jgi:hypothetical protein
MEVGEMPESDRRTPVEATRRESAPPGEPDDTYVPSGDETGSDRDDGDGPEKAGVPPGSRGDEDDYEGGDAPDRAR